MPRVEPPPPPQRRVIEPAIVEPSPAVRVVPEPSVTVVPEHARYEFGNPAGYALARFFAFALDVGLIAAVVTSLAYSLIAINPITGLPTNSRQGFDATLALGVAFALVYVWAAEAAFGTTIGKLALGLHVYAVRGGPVGLGRALVRMLLRPIDLLAIGAVLALLPGHRRLGDIAGGTIVAKSPLRRFGPYLGWFFAIVVAGVPFILAGAPRTFSSLIAFYEFVPPLAVSIWNHVHALVAPR